MDNVQLNQMVAWLDEEHRKDRGEIARLQQQLEAQALEAQEQGRRLRDLEGRLAGTQAQLTRFAQIEQASQQLKSELVLLIDRIKEDVLRSERETERARMSDREAMARAISELRKEMPRFGRIEEELSVRKTEDQRLGEVVLDIRQQVATLGKELDERTRTIPYISEQRTQDVKRIGQLQQETIELFKRIDAVATRLPVLEEEAKRAARDVQAILPIPPELKRVQESFIEQVKLAQVDQGRQLRDFRDEIVGYRDAIEAQNKRLQELAEGVDQSKRAALTIEQFQQVIRREKSQVTELQRLAEERQRRELETFQTEYEKRWQREILNWQQRWQQQDQFNQEIVKGFPPLDVRIKDLAVHITHLWRLHEEYGAYRQYEAQRWQETLDEALEQRDQIGGGQDPSTITAEPVRRSTSAPTPTRR